MCFPWELWTTITENLYYAQCFIFFFDTFLWNISWKLLSQRRLLRKNDTVAKQIFPKFLIHFDNIENHIQSQSTFQITSVSTHLVYLFQRKFTWFLSNRRFVFLFAEKIYIPIKMRGKNQKKWKYEKEKNI